MDKSGPIVVIDDNAADQRIYTEIFKELDFMNEIMFFDDALNALNF